MPSIVLNPGREKSVINRHPWIFENSIQKVHDSPEIGESVDILTSNGEWLARGAISPHSKIRIRIWTWDVTEKVDTDFFYKRIVRCKEYREYLTPWINSTAFRLVYAEADDIPGLIVDKYAETLVVQCLSAGVERWREEVFNILEDITGIHQIYERSDVDIRGLEGLECRKGQVLGNSIENPIIITENNIKFSVDFIDGQKTGFYLDQRENRSKIIKYAEDREILDCFSYTGGFTLASLAGGAKSITAVDESQSAHDIACTNVNLNGFSAEKVERLNGDVFKVLRDFRDRRKLFDMIILDPPKFAPTISQVGRATRGYKDINLLALKLLRPGGILVTFSCSGGVNAALFQKIVSGAALDASVHAQIVERLSQSPDHPVAINFPESEYLKGLVIRKMI
jgi:23S rRNA (cytosine1962-C5)-methyltransferase